MSLRHQIQSRGLLIRSFFILARPSKKLPYCFLAKYNIENRRLRQLIETRDVSQLVAINSSLTTSYQPASNKSPRRIICSLERRAAARSSGARGGIPALGGGAATLRTPHFFFSFLTYFAIPRETVKQMPYSPPMD